MSVIGGHPPQEQIDGYACGAIQCDFIVTSAKRGNWDCAVIVGEETIEADFQCFL